MKKTESFMERDTSKENRIFERMQKPVILPEEVESAKSAAFSRIREMEQLGAGDNKAVRVSGEPAAEGFRWTVWKSFAGAAAAAAVFSLVCITHPAFAAKIPLVGHVFEQIGNSLGFQGDFEQYAVALDETADESAGGESGVFTQEKNGMTVTLSEKYCNDTALYLSVVLTTEDAFPETMLDQDGQPIIDILGSTLKLDYNPDAISLGSYLDGAMIDEHTYAGVLRINLDQTRRLVKISEDVPEGEKPETDDQITYETVSLPEEFVARLHVPEIHGALPESTMPDMPEDIRQTYEKSMAEAGLDTSEEAYESFTEEEKELEHELFTQMWKQYYERYPEADDYPNSYENWWVEGPWDFEVAVKVDHSETEMAAVNTDEKCDIGRIEVTRTPFELVLNYDPIKASDKNYYIVVLDAEGKPLGTGHAGGSLDEHPTAGHDVSEVTVFVCDWDKYLDELNGYYLAEDYPERAKEKTFRQLLEEESVYFEEVSFGEK